MNFNTVGSTLKVINLILVRTPILVVHETQIEIFQIFNQKGKQELVVSIEHNLSLWYTNYQREK